jgi:hypothetical protein
MDSSPFLAGHGTAPTGVLHAVARCGVPQSLFFEADISQTFECCWVGDVRAWLLGCSGSFYDDDAGEAMLG